MSNTVISRNFRSFTKKCVRFLLGFGKYLVTWIWLVICFHLTTEALPTFRIVPTWRLNACKNIQGSVKWRVFKRSINLTNKLRWRLTKLTSQFWWWNVWTYPIRKSWKKIAKLTHKIDFWSDFRICLETYHQFYWHKSLLDLSTLQ